MKNHIITATVEETNTGYSAFLANLEKGFVCTTAASITELHLKELGLIAYKKNIKLSFHL